MPIKVFTLEIMEDGILIILDGTDLALIKPDTDKHGSFLVYKGMTEIPESHPLEKLQPLIDDHVRNAIGEWPWDAPKD